MLITQSLEAMVWLRSQGVRFVPNYRHQSAVVDGKRKFFGRMPLWASGGGPGLVQSLTDTALKKGIEIFYDTRAVSLIYDGEHVLGVKAKRGGKPVEFQRARGDARLRRLRSQSRMAHALPRPGLGTGESARHALQHGRRTENGARHRRLPLRQLVGPPRRLVGTPRAGVRRPQLLEQLATATAIRCR